MQVQTNNGHDEGFYQIVLKGYTRYYLSMPNIPIDTLFTI